MLTIREKEYTQAGHNPNFPMIITTWKIGEEVPEWLSDRAKIGFIDGTGTKVIQTRNTTTGGVEIISSDGVSTLITVRANNDVVCIDRNNLKISKIFTLTEDQLDLLYYSLS